MNERTKEGSDERCQGGEQAEPEHFQVGGRRSHSRAAVEDLGEDARREQWGPGFRGPSRRAHLLGGKLERYREPRARSGDPLGSFSAEKERCLA